MSSYTKERFNEMYENNANPYNSLQRASELERLELSYELIKKYASNDHLLLDIGCGTGIFTSRIAPMFKRTLAKDISEEGIRLANELNPSDSIEYQVGNLDGDQTNKWDMITALEMIYLMPKDEQRTFMKNAHSELKVGGLFISSFLVGEKYISKQDMADLFGSFQKVEEIKSYRFLFRNLENLLFKIRKHIFPKNKLLDRLVNKVSGSQRLMKFFDGLTKIFMGEKGITRVYLAIQKM